MSSIKKAIKRIKTCPSDYTYTEARTLATHFGYAELSKGSTSGSRVLFYRERDGQKILLHKPHPGDVMKQYAVRQLLRAFIESGDIDE